MSANTYSISEIQGFLRQVYGKQMPDGSVQVPQMTVYPYGYTASFTTLAQNASATQLLQITANADFILFGVSYRAAISAAQTVTSKTAAFVRLLLTDSGTNEQFTAQPVDLENYCTNGGDDRPLTYPRFIAGKSSITVAVTNYAPTAETYSSLDIYFDGVLARVRG